MKLFRKTSTSIMILMLIGMIAAVGGINRFYANDSNSNKTTWQEDVKNDINASQKQAHQVPHAEAEALKERIAMDQYRLDKGIAPVSDTSFWGFASDGVDKIMMFVTIFAIIIGGGMVSSEFGEGTIKLLLTRPVNRYIILLSKYISLLYTSIILAAVGFVFSLLVACVLFGFDELPLPHLSYFNGAVHEGSVLLYILTNYGYNFVQLIIFGTIAFMISTLFRNSALAIGFTMFMMMGSGLIVMFLSRFDWVKYVLFANVNLSVYSNGGNGPVVNGMTLGFSVAVLALYYLIFIAVTCLSFNKRDIAA